MDSILKDLFYGRLELVGKSLEEVEELRGKEREKDVLFHKIAADMTPGDRERLESFSELCAEIAADNECGGFLCGFRLGAHFMTELKNKSDGRPPDL